MSDLILAGSVILALAALTFGEIICQRYSKYVKNIISFKRLLIHIRSSIEIYKMPLPDIYASFEDEYFEEIGLISDIKKYGLNIFLSEHVSCLNSENEDIKTLIKTLGQGSTDESVGFLNLYIEKITEKEKHAVGELSDKKKLCRTLSGLAGLSFLIMFI